MSKKSVYKEGDRVGNFYLIYKREAGKNAKGYRMVEFTCDYKKCGNTKVTAIRYVKRGGSRSCGCLGLESQRLSKGQSGKNEAYKRHRWNAKDRNLTPLPENEWYPLTQQLCYWCGAEPSGIYFGNTRNERNKEWSKFVYNGIDRVDNNKGYVLENCVSCCKDCNRLKMDLTVEHWLSHMKKILNHQESKQNECYPASSQSVV